MLQWLVAAARPLTLYEIRAAVALRSYETNARLGNRLSDPQWLFRLCGPLVRLTSDEDPDKRELSLAHFSLKEYLVSGELRNSSHIVVQKYDVVLSDANAYLATVSLAYLSSQELSKPFRTKQELDQMRQDYRLMDYATVYGGMHLLPLDRANDKIIELLDGLLIPEVAWCALEAHHDKPATPLKITFTAFPPTNLENCEFVSWPEKCGISAKGEVPENIKKEIVKPLVEKTVDSIKSHLNCKVFLQLFRILSDPMRKDHPVNVTPLYYSALFG